MTDDSLVRCRYKCCLLYKTRGFLMKIGEGLFFFNFSKDERELAIISEKRTHGYCDSHRSRGYHRHRRRRQASAGGMRLRPGHTPFAAASSVRNSVHAQLLILYCFSVDTSSVYTVYEISVIVFFSTPLRPDKKKNKTR